MKKILMSLCLALMCSGAAFAQQSDSAATNKQKMAELEKSLDEITESTMELLNKLKNKVVETTAEKEDLSDEEVADLQEKISRESEQYAAKMEAWAEKMEAWAEEKQPEAEATAKEVEKHMEEWAVEFAKTMEEWAADFEKKYNEAKEEK